MSDCSSRASEPFFTVPATGMALAFSFLITVRHTLQDIDRTVDAFVEAGEMILRQHNWSEI